ncbi:polymer-forming cytoskeletal protein [Paenibacillus sp. TRM 82003]|nr:polymer-forming cytoskeletal protein [Paenibacillus sp. TRM 82003]
MGWFGKRQADKNVSATDTLIGEGTIVEGKIVTTASLRIEGSVVGDIECSGDVTIGEKGSARSIIAARNVFNAGAIAGSVRAKGKLTITSRGRVEGDIHVGSLHVSEGGVLSGVCEMDAPPAKNSELQAAKARDKNTAAPATGGKDKETKQQASA